MAKIAHQVAIITKYHGPSNVRGARIIASVPVNKGQRIVRVYSYSLDSDGNHAAAAQALADKMGWPGELIGGALDTGYAFVFVRG